MTQPQRTRRVNFHRIADAALSRAHEIVSRWLPDGRREANEWVARNPTRADHRPGSFKINLRSGQWSDFATGERGGDLVALAAYLHGLPMREAAIRVAEMIGVDPYE